MSGYGPPATSGTAAPVASGAAVAGYQIVVSSVRPGRFGRSTLRGVGRVVSTKVSVTTPTPGSVCAAPAPEPLQSAVLQPALAALRALPDFDHERVAALRDALARGELPFDAARLAGLIERFHGGQP